LNCLIVVLTVTVIGFSVIPNQKKKYITGLTDYSKLIHSALSPVVSASIVLEDYGEAIESSLTVIDENPIVLYVLFIRNDGLAIITMNKKWNQVYDETMFRLKDQGQQFIDSTIVKREVFNTSYPISHSGIGYGYICIGLSTDQYHDDMRALYAGTFFITFVSVLVSLFFSYILSRKLIMPIQKLAETAIRIGSGDLSVRSDIRTGDEIETLSHAFNRMVSALQISRAENMKKHEALLDIAHQAGMAEVAINVLHNVGNALNSVHVIITSVSERVRNSRVSNIGLLARDIEAHMDCLSDYLEKDGLAEKMLQFLDVLARHLEDENSAISKDMGILSTHVGHITDIIKFQRFCGKPLWLTETVKVLDLIDMAIQLSENTIESHGIRIEVKTGNLPDMALNRSKVIQILNNLITNAVDAVIEKDAEDKIITVSSDITDDGFLSIRVKDNGIGIPESNRIRIFHHGFTTKKHGHGFGLHSCALFAQEMKGSLNEIGRAHV
jgi:signal transduction histidine kinase